MKKNLLLLGFMVCTLTMMGQTQKKDSWYFKVGGSYFTQATATEFPTVGGQAANRDVYVAGKLTSRESITGSFGEGFRYGGNIGYRFTNRLGVEMGINYYKSNSKTMAQTVDRVVAAGPTLLNFTAKGQVKALDLAPALVLFLGEVKGFETYSKVGVIVPVNGKLVIDTDKSVKNPLGETKTFSRDEIKPNPSVGFMAALGTSYKLGKNFSLYGEVEYRNFTVHGKTRETTVHTVNGTSDLSTLSVSTVHTNYTNQLNSSSNNAAFNTVDTTKPTDDQSSYISISGVGLTLGLKYSL